MNKKARLIFILLSVSLFIFSLFRNCYLVEDKETVGSIGLFALLFGFFNASQSFVVWFANPIYFISIFLFYSDKKTSRITSFLSIFLGLLFLVLNKVLINEGGTVGQVEEYLSGYWFWIASFIVLFFGSVVNFLDKENNNV